MELQDSRPRDFRRRLENGPILGDGAMATMLHHWGAPVRTCYEELCLTAPTLVRQVHATYVAAGAELLQTNTFSAHRAGLTRFGLEDRMLDINQAAVRLAREAAGPERFVFGTIGSIIGLRSVGGVEDEAHRLTLAAQFQAQAECLITEDLDGILLETFADLAEMMTAIAAVRQVTKLPIIANLSPDTVGVTRDGVPIHEAFLQMARAGADVVGLNCRLGPSGILRSYEDMELPPHLRFAAVPNAGTLYVADGDYTYTGSVDYFADTLSALLRRGVQVIGGCCGTTPEHIQELAGRLQSGQWAAPSSAAPILPSTATDGVATVPHAVQSERAAILQVSPSVRPPLWPDGEETLVDRVAREVTVIVELDPPRTLDTTRYLRGAEALAQAGADVITLADNSLGMVRVSNMALASLLKSRGIEPLVHVTCRDRNLIGQQSHLMGLHVLGIHHILLVTGDPSRFGDLPGATSVFDVSSIELTRMVKRLNAGVAFSGQPLQRPARFIVGTSFNPNVLHFDKAIDRLRRKVAAGADYVMTQPVFDPAMFERIARATENLGVPMFIGVMPLVSERNALFLHNEVPGIQIPEDTMQRMRLADTAAAADEGLRIAEELLTEALHHFRGIYLVTPFLRYELSAHLTAFVRQRVAQRAGSAHH